MHSTLPVAILFLSLEIVAHAVAVLARNIFHTHRNETENDGRWE